MTSIHSVQELVALWQASCARMRDQHFKMADRFQRRHLSLGIPTLILSIVVGTSAFGNFGKSVEKDSAKDPVSIPLKLLVLGVSIGSVVLTSLQTFVKYEDRATKHRVAAKGYHSLSMELEQFLVQVYANSLDAKTAEVVDRLSALRKAYDGILKDAPEIPESDWKKTPMTYDLSGVIQPKPPQEASPATGSAAATPAAIGAKKEDKAL